MKTFWFLIYNILLLPLFWIGVQIASLFNSKIRMGLSGRKQKIPVFSNADKIILIHSSSLGEYQQAIPLIDEFLKLKYKIVLTFFSPSGFDNVKVTNPDIVKLYLPFDSYRNIKKFINRIKPKLLVLMRYDLWFNLLYYCKKKNIEIILANARFDENDLFWKLPVTKSFKRSLYNFIDKIFVIDEQDEYHYKKLLRLPPTEIITVGDSKFERVYESSKKINNKLILNNDIIDRKKIFVVGSSWKQDEDVILPVIDKIIKYENNLLTILVPHEPKETKLKLIENNLTNKYPNIKFIRYSSLNNYNGENFIIVDCVGKLMGLYSIAEISYVGGGFKSGLHNILEPAVFNIPVIFNNKVKNSDEDELMLKYGCGIVIEDSTNFYRTMRALLKDENLRNEIGNNCKELFEKTLGTANKILENLSNIK